MFAVKVRKTWTVSAAAWGVRGTWCKRSKSRGQKTQRRRRESTFWRAGLADFWAAHDDEKHPCEQAGEHGGRRGNASSWTPTPRSNRCLSSVWKDWSAQQQQRGVSLSPSERSKRHKPAAIIKFMNRKRKNALRRSRKSWRDQKSTWTNTRLWKQDDSLKRWKWCFHIKKKKEHLQFYISRDSCLRVGSFKPSDSPQGFSEWFSSRNYSHSVAHNEDSPVRRQGLKHSSDRESDIFYSENNSESFKARSRLVTGLLIWHVSVLDVNHLRRTN